MLAQSAYADEADDKKVADFLTSFGFIDKSDTESTDKAVTRGEFADLAVKLIPYELDIFTPQEQKFSDVPASSDIYNGVMLLADRGIIRGVSAIKFAPEENIAFNDACAVMVRILGYEFRVTDGNYANQAAVLGITEGVHVKDSVITKADVFRMMYNCLFADIKTGNNMDGFFEDFDSGKMMEKRFKIYEVYGTVTDDGFTALNGKTNIGRGNISIDGVVFKNVSGIDNAIGCSVYAYYKDDGGGDCIKYMYISERKNVIEEYKDEYIRSFGSGAYEVYTNEQQTKTSRKTLAAGYTVIYNRHAVTGGITQQQLNSLMKPDCGRIRLIDNNNDGRFETVVIESFQTVAVNGYYKDTKTLYNKLPSPKFICFENVDEIYAENSAGTYMTIDTVEENNIISAAQSIDGDYAYVIISTDKASGILETVSDDNEKLTINGEVYKTAPELRASMHIPNVGSKVSAYLRHDGKIAFIKTETGENGIFAYLHKVYVLDDGEERAGITVFTEQKEVKQLIMAEKPILDGERYTDAAAVCAYLKNHKYAINNLVILKLNADNEVVNIDCAYYGNDSEGYSTPGEREEKNSLHIAGDRYNVNSKLGTKILNNCVGVDETTKVFIIPSNENKPIKSAFDIDVNNINLNDAAVSNVNATNVNAYDAAYPHTVYITDDSSMLADAIILYRNTAGWDINNSNVASRTANNIVTGINCVINSDNEPCWKISYTNGGAPYEIYTQTLNGNKCKLKGTEVKTGDIIKFGTDKAGRIPDNQLVIMYSPSHDKDNIIYDSGDFIEGKISDLTGSYTYGIIMGKVYEMNDRFLRLSRNNGTERLIPISKMKYVIYDEDSYPKVDYGDWTDINTITAAGDSEASRVVFDWDDGAVNFVYIIR